MIKKIKSIDIIPAVFIEYREDGNALIRCLQGNKTIDRAFELILIAGIKNPKYLFLGIMTGGNTMGLNVCDGNEFENLYHEKWSVLLK